MTSVKIIIEFNRHGSGMGGKKVEMNPAIHIEKYQDDDFPVVVEPWIVEKRGDRNCVGPASKKQPEKVREHVCNTERNYHNPPETARNDFHARLIAAAPEMYVALLSVAAEFEARERAFKSENPEGELWMEIKSLLSKIEVQS